MERRRHFLIKSKMLMDHAMELAILLESHVGMCMWLGPYETEDNEDDCVAKHYKAYFEERLSYLLLTLAIQLRTLDDRELIARYTKREDPKQVDLGKIREGDKWNEIDNLRTVCNFLIHATEVIPEPHVENVEIDAFEIKAVRRVKSFSGSISILGKLKRKDIWIDTMMQLNLRPFCDMVFRVVEGLPADEAGS
jgi:hypothetical protein